MTIDEDLNFVQPVLVFFKIKILLKRSIKTALNSDLFTSTVSAEEWLKESYKFVRKCWLEIEYMT